MTDTLVLIDGHALVFRAFYGVPPLTTPKGELVNAVHGFTSMLFKVWRELKPRYVIATFDYSSKTFRKAKFPEYKGTRGPAPEPVTKQQPARQQQRRSPAPRQQKQPAKRAKPRRGR